MNDVEAMALIRDFIKLAREICTGTSMSEEEADMLTAKAVAVIEVLKKDEI